MATKSPEKLRRECDAAAAEVATLEARHAEREDEAAILTAEIALLSEQIAAADARGEPTAALESERERRLQRQRDLAAVLPLLEQQLAEARAELHEARRQLGGAQLAADESAWVADGRAFAADFRRDVLDPFGARGAALLDRLAQLTRDEEALDQLNGRRSRGWKARDRAVRDTGLLVQQLLVLREWAAGRPIQVEGPGQPQARPAGAPDAVEARMLQAGVR